MLERINMWVLLAGICCLSLLYERHLNENVVSTFVPPGRRIDDVVIEARERYLDTREEVPHYN